MNMIKKIMYCSVIITAVFAPVLQCQDTRNLIMLLDVYNDENPKEPSFPVLFSLIPALIEKSTPIFMSPAVWNNFIVRKNRFKAAELTENPQKVLAEIQAAAKIKPAPDDDGNVNDDAQNLNVDLMCYATPFNPNEWIIKKIDNIAYVLIPVAYANTIEKNSAKFIQTIPMKNKNETIFASHPANSKKPGNLTQQELLLGLKVDHWDDVDNIMSAPIFTEKEQKQAIENFDWTTLFVTRKDLGLMAAGAAPAQYAAYQKTLLDQYKNIPGNKEATLEAFEQYLLYWFLYMVGHGDITLSEAEKEQQNLKIEEETATLQAFNREHRKALGLPEEYDEDEAGDDEEDDSESDSDSDDDDDDDDDNGLIANLSIKQFLRFVKFLNFSVNTKLLFYTSCFSGGQHTDPTFQYDYEHKTKNLNIPHNLNFTVIAGGLTNTALKRGPIELHTAPSQKNAAGLVTRNIAINGTQLIMGMDPNFELFFKELESYFYDNKNKKALSDITNIVHPFKSFTASNTYRVVNIPLVRFPYTEWFKVTGINKDVNILDRKTITSFIEQEKDFVVNKSGTVLAYEPYVPMPIIFETGEPAWQKPQVNVNKIIPMNTRYDSYFFKQVTTPEKNLANVFKIFTPLKNIFHKNAFYIEKLGVTLTDNAGMPGDLGHPAFNNQKVTLYNVIITQDAYFLTGEISVNFMFNGRPYKAIVADYYKEFTKSLFPVDDILEVEKYKADFTNRRNLLGKEFYAYARTVSNIIKNQKEKLKRGPVPLGRIARNLRNSSRQKLSDTNAIIKAAHDGDFTKLYTNPSADTTNTYLEPSQHGIKPYFLPLSPLSITIMDRNMRPFNVLLPIADVNADDNSLSLSPLHYAALAGNTDAAQQLLDRKADINAQNSDGDTALHIASRLGASELVTLLLTEGADPSLKNKKGEIAKLQKLEPQKGLLESLQILGDSLRSLTRSLR